MISTAARFVIVLAFALETCGADDVPALPAGEAPPHPGAERAPEVITFEQFQVEAPAAWQRWKEQLRARNYSVRVVTRSHTAENDTEFQKSFCRAGQHTLSQLSLPQTGKVPNREIAWGQNDSYYFVARRSTNDPWTVADFGRPDQRPQETARRYPSEDRDQFPQFFVEDVPLEKLIADPGFVVEAVDEPAEPDRFQVRFKCNVGPDQWTTITGGVLSFQADRNWLLEEYELQLQSRTRGTSRGRLSYRDFMGLPVVDNWSLDYRFEGDSPIQNLHELTWAENGCPEESFTLAHYGLPEPYSTPGASARSWQKWGLIASTTVLVVIAVLLNRLAAGKQSAQNAGT